MSARVHRDGVDEGSEGYRGCCPCGWVAESAHRGGMGRGRARGDAITHLEDRAALAARQAAHAERASA